MSDKKLTTIPFSGFYHSIHDQELDATLHNMFSDDSGTPYEGLLERAFDAANWTQIHTEYAKEYARSFANVFKLETLTFESLVSPKYYNYETDRVFCHIDVSEVIKIYQITDKKSLQNAIKRRFTSRDGFISHYPNSLESWPEDVCEWDHNQIGTLIEVYAEQLSGDDFSSLAEFEVLDEPFELSYRIIEQNIEGADRYFRIAEYLREREARTQKNYHF